MSEPAASTAAGSNSRHLVQLGAAALSAFIFFAVLATGSRALQPVWSFPEAQGIQPKFTYFAQHKAEFDTLFLGSSRFYHQIIPRQFDAATALAGVQTRSFNFAYDGVWPPESYYLLRRILELHPPHLRWVVIDLMEINANLEARNRGTLRTVYWHDWKHTSMAVRDVLASKIKGPVKLDLTLTHARLFLQSAINLGRGSDWLAQRCGVRKQKQKPPPSWAEDFGFEAGPEKPMTGEVLVSYLTAVDQLRRKLPPFPIRPLFRQALRDLIADVRSAGAEPIFVIAPTINPRENFSGVPDGAAVFAFNDPTKHPKLFEPDRHYDAWHLTKKGAVEFTDLLATKFSEHAKVQR